MEIACLMCGWPIVYEESKMYGTYGTTVRDYYIKIVTPDILEKRNAVENLETFWNSPITRDEPCTVFEFTDEEEEHIDNLVNEYIKERRLQIGDNSQLWTGEHCHTRLKKLREKAEKEVWNKKDIPTFMEWFNKYRKWWLEDFCFDHNGERESVGLLTMSTIRASKKLWDALIERSKFDVKLKIEGLKKD